MSAYSIRYSQVFGFPAVVLSDNKSGASVQILLRGARVNNFFIPLGDNGGLFDIIAGYESGEEIERGYAAKSFIMAPFSNRIQGGRYGFQSNDYDFRKDGFQKVSHGLVHNADFWMETSVITDSEITCRLTTDKLETGRFQAYPFSLKFSVTFTLRGTSLTIRTEAVNTGSVDAPFSTGWHPYFRFPSGIGDVIPTVDASDIVLIDQDFIPLSGSAAFSPIENHPELDYRKCKLIGDSKVNVCYILKTSNTKEKRCSSLYHIKDKIRVTLLQDYGVVYIYTADDFRGDKRDMVAFEPVECITNAFNREELADTITIPPGASKVFEMICIAETGV